MGNRDRGGIQVVRCITFKELEDIMQVLMFDFLTRSVGLLPRVAYDHHVISIVHHRKKATTHRYPSTSSN